MKKAVLGALFVLTLACTTPVGAQDITGTWHLAAETEVGTLTQTFVLAQDGTHLDGSVDLAPDDDASLPVRLADGIVIGRSFTFTISLEFGPNVMQRLYAGTFDGDTMQGTMREGQSDALAFTAERDR